MDDRSKYAGKSALPPEADIKLESVQRSANDPKRTLAPLDNHAIHTQSFGLFVAGEAANDIVRPHEYNQQYEYGEKLMRIKSILTFVTLFTVSGAAFADLEVYKDYDISDAVWSVTTVRVNANMDDAYLEGIKNTWASGNKVAMELGQIESWSIFRSDLPQSGDFNLLLIVKFANSSDLAPNKERYDAFMKEFGEAKNKEATEYSQKNYPAMRELTGEYLMREITLK